MQEGGATLEEVGQQAESYRADLEARGQELARVKGEKEALERKVGMVENTVLSQTFWIWWMLLQVLTPRDLVIAP